MTEAAEDTSAELRANIKRIFSWFDKDDRGTVVVEEVPTMMRALGVFPSEKDVVEKVLPEMQEDEPTDYVTYERFEKNLLEVLQSGEFAPDSEDTLLQAFRAIDTDRKGYIEEERLRELLTGTDTTYFRAKEISSFLEAAREPGSSRIYYEDYVALLARDVKSAI